MLVVSRKVGERIKIGADIVVTVTEIGRGRVRIGVEAPRHIPIVRDNAGPAKPQTNQETP